jgi:hypothetical protein
MDMNSILGRTVSGFAVKAAAAVLALYVAGQAWAYVAHVFGAVNNALPM